MLNLTVPEPPELIYSYCRQPGGSVPLSRPICQGDVFEGIDVAPFDPAPYAMVLTHPCSMRRGPVLRPFVSVAAVRRTGEPVAALFERNGHVMPLPDLCGADSFAALDEMVAVRTSNLNLTGRVACLDDYGISILQQRHIRHMTRYVVEIEALHEVNAPVLLELELLEAWREDAFRGKSVEECLAIESQVNLEFDEAFKQFRGQALDPSRHSRIRREMLAKGRAG